MGWGPFYSEQAMTPWAFNREASDGILISQDWLAVRYDFRNWFVSIAA